MLEFLLIGRPCGAFETVIRDLDLGPQWSLFFLLDLTMGNVDGEAAGAIALYLYV